MNLSNRPVFLKNKPGITRKKKINIGKYIYLTILCITAIVLIYIGYDKLFYVTGLGQIVYQSTNIRSDNDIKIVDIMVGEGDDVKPGDSLLLYSYNNSESEIRSEIDKYLTESELKKIEKKNIDIQRADYQKKQMQLKPFAAYSRDELESIKSKILACDIASNAISEQLKTLNGKIDSLQKGKNVEVAVHVMRATMAGQIGDVFKSKGEQALKSDVILVMLDINKIWINAYFEQKDVGALAVKKRVTLHFPDQTTGTGTINKFFISTKPLPVEFQKKYEPTQREVSADIYPVNDGEKASWKKYFKMNVKVKVRK